MSRRQALPNPLLMTDERMGDGLWTALARLPRGAGVVFRHYATPRAERRALYERVRAVARRRNLVLLVAGTAQEAATWRADGVHGSGPTGGQARPLLRSVACHSRRDLVAARRTRADLLLVSPVFPTRSHPGARALGRSRLGLMIGRTGEDIVALGGMTRHRARSLAGLSIARWAAIDAWL